jgi:hypothetical protein
MIRDDPSIRRRSCRQCTTRPAQLSHVVSRARSRPPPRAEPRGGLPQRSSHRPKRWRMMPRYSSINMRADSLDEPEAIRRNRTAPRFARIVIESRGSAWNKSMRGFVDHRFRRHRDVNRMHETHRARRNTRFMCRRSAFSKIGGHSDGGPGMAKNAARPPAGSKKNPGAVPL